VSSFSGEHYICVFAALGPYPTGADAHFDATGFMADSLFAWNAFAATLLIPYQAAACASSTAGALVRGILWGAIFSVGAITKVSFLYFIVLTIPILFVVSIRHSGVRCALLSLISLTVCSLPVTLYWLRYGQPVLSYGRAASFGPTAHFYYVPFSQFLDLTIRQSPGVLLSGIFAIFGAAYLIVKRRDVAWGTNVLPLLIMLGYCTISLASTNREIRFLFPAIIASPFLIGILISGKTYVLSRGHAIIAAIFVFCCLVVAGVPMLHRANRQSLHMPEVVLAQAIESNAKRIVLATDSPSLNYSLIKVAIAVSPVRPPVQLIGLDWRAASGLPIEGDFRDIRESDLVIFQDKQALDSPFTNQRVPEYERYTLQHFGMPIKIVDGISIYGKHYDSQ
jgi:hypothetical protein